MCCLFVCFFFWLFCSVGVCVLWLVFCVSRVLVSCMRLSCVFASWFLISWLCVLYVLCLVSVVCCMSVLWCLFYLCVCCVWCLCLWLVRVCCALAVRCSFVSVSCACWYFAYCLLLVVYWSVVLLCLVCCGSCISCWLVGWLFIVCACGVIFVWCCWSFCFCFVVLPRLFLRSGFVFLVFVLGWLGVVVCFGGWGAALFKGRRFSGILAHDMPQTLYPSIIE